MINKIYEKIKKQDELIQKIVISKEIQIIKFGKDFNRTNADFVAPRFKQVEGKNFNIFYDDEPHLYFLQIKDKRQSLISVTTLIELYAKEFKEKEMAQRCARKENYVCDYLDKNNWQFLSHWQRKNQILKAWKTNNEIASYYGTVVHAAMETTVLNLKAPTENIYKYIVQRYQYPIEYIQLFIDELKLFLSDNYSENYFQFIAEPIVFCLEIMSTGQADLVILDHFHKKIHILDYKTNKEKPGTERVFNKMFYPFQKMNDVNFSHYKIQLRLYQRFLLKQYPDYIAGDLILLWMNRETGKIEPVYIDYTEYDAYINILYSQMKKIKNKIFYKNNIIY